MWVPAPKTPARRDLLHAQRKAVKRTTQMRSRLRSSLSDNGVRLPQGTRLAQNAALEASLRAAQDWPPGQWQVIEGLLLELRHAEEQRQPWRSLSAQAALADPRKLVKHLGLNPAFDVRLPGASRGGGGKGFIARRHYPKSG